MIITCPYCKSHYKIEEILISKNGRKVKCFNCANFWIQFPGGKLTKLKSEESFSTELARRQNLIRNSLEYFMGAKIEKKYYGIDGCSAPQYAFELKDLSQGLINLISSYNDKFAFNGTEPTSFSAALSTSTHQDAIADQATSTAQKLMFTMTSADGGGQDYDIHITYIDQNNA